MLMALGAVFSPLPSADFVGDYIDIEAALPDNAPQREQHIHAELVRRGMDPAGGAWSIEQLVSRLANWPRFRAVVLRLRRLVPQPDQPIVLVSPAARCESCNKDSLEIEDRPSAPTIFTSEGRRAGVLYAKLCRACGARHSLSFVTGGHVPDEHQRPLRGCLDAEYFQLGSTAYAVKHVLRRFTTQATHSHTAFETFCSEYYDFFGSKMTRQAFARCYLVFALLVMLEEYGYDGVPDIMTSVGAQSYIFGESPLDRTLRSFIPWLSRAFTSKWAGRHTQYCRQPTTCNCWIFDGHMKCRRVTCDNDKAREVVVPQVGTMVLGCPHTPLKTSRFCFHCQAAAARLNQLCEPCEPKGMLETQLTAQAADDERTEQALAAEDETAELDEALDCNAPDEETELSPAAQSTYLVERLTDSRPARRMNEQTTYRSMRVKECMNKKHTGTHAQISNLLANPHPTPPLAAR